MTFAASPYDPLAPANENTRLPERSDRGRIVGLVLAFLASFIFWAEVAFFAWRFL